jgi:hypothetical protein
MQIHIALIPFNYLDLCVLQRYHQNIYVSNAFVSSNKNYIYLNWLYFENTLVKPSFLFRLK